MNTLKLIKELVVMEWERMQVLGSLAIRYNEAKCNGCGECYEVCPVGCWEMDWAHHRSKHISPQACVACGACQLQCPEGAISLA